MQTGMQQGIINLQQLTHVLQSYELLGLECAIGDIINQTVGLGGWLLLEKIANNVTDDYTQNSRLLENKTAQYN